MEMLLSYLDPAVLGPYLRPVLLLPLVALVAVVLCFGRWRAGAGTTTGLEWITRPRDLFALPCHPMTRRDLAPLAAVTLLYAVTAFWNLGAPTAPQSFLRMEPGTEILLRLTGGAPAAQVRYYPGLNTGSYHLSYSPDGVSWEEVGTLDQAYDALFQWHTLDLTPARFTGALRITARPDGDWMELGELAVYDAGGAPLAVAVEGGGDAAPLTDEAATVPDAPSWYNSAYFDEIYHPRTAYEHLRGQWPYEITHPPLGKLLMGLGIRVFGMTPLGWRCVGALLGTAMLPVLYVFLKNLFGKTAAATCGTIVLAADFMHLTQTRIGTIDTYAVFFILTMYFFLYRWITLPAGTPVGRSALPLCLSGLMFGLGAASKWTVLYGGAGMAVLYCLALWQKHRDWPLPREAEGCGPSFGRWAAGTVALSLLAFVVVPACIYVACYLPYQTAAGGSGLKHLLTLVGDNQQYMWNYHRGVTQSHPYASRWWQWLFDLRPILYYREETAQGLRTAFAAFNNPLVSWMGLLSVGAVAVTAAGKRCGRALFLVVGYLAQLLPWLPITRPTFAYHYSPCTVFLVLCICAVISEYIGRTPRWKPLVYGFTGLTAGLYALFYPVLVGLPIPAWYATHLLQWFPSWPL